MLHEKLLFERFIQKGRQERYLTLIKSKKGRIKLREYISHFKDLDNNFIQEINIIQDSQHLENLLKSNGATDPCYVISEHSKYDDRFLTLNDATKELFNSGITYFLSCIPGKLAYYEGEEPNQRFLLINNSK